jgi:UDP-N-acetylglucosamine acyltransferase
LRKQNSLSIHPSAVVSADAVIDSAATIGPFCVIEGRVEIGADTVVDSHARSGHRFGHVRIGSGNHIQHGAVLGGPPQDVGYSGGKTRLVIGDQNRIGEYVSISQGTEKGGLETRIHDNTMLMAFVHIGHDCDIGNKVVITNGTQLAGHVVVEDHALLSGLAGVTQYTRLGRYCFLTAGSFANKDIPPFTIAEGHWAKPRAVNRVALKRAGFSFEERHAVESAIRILFDTSLPIETVIERIKDLASPYESVQQLVEFLASSSRGIARR